MASVGTTNPVFSASNLLTDPVRNFRFLVQFLPHSGTTTTGNDAVGKAGFAPIANLGFATVSGLTVATESIAYREGGYNTTVHQIPGQTTFQPITMSRGVLLGTNQHQAWMKQLFATISGTGSSGAGADFRCNVDISVLTHPNPGEWKNSNGDKATSVNDMHVSMRFRVYNAWIQSLAYSEMNSMGNEIMVEALTLVHEGWDLQWAANYAASADQFTF